jgi:hypothetical protein
MDFHEAVKIILKANPAAVRKKENRQGHLPLQVACSSPLQDKEMLRYIQLVACSSPLQDKEMLRYIQLLVKHFPE